MYLGIVLQKYFEHFVAQHWFKIRRERATTIQRSPRPDSIVTNFYFTEAAWRLLQHNPNESGKNGKPSVVLFQKAKDQFEQIWTYGESAFPLTTSDLPDNPEAQETTQKLAYRGREDGAQWRHRF
jgi:hypothetical protein